MPIYNQNPNCELEYTFSMDDKAFAWYNSSLNRIEVDICHSEVESFNDSEFFITASVSSERSNNKDPLVTEISQGFIINFKIKYI